MGATVLTGKRAAAFQTVDGDWMAHNTDLTQLALEWI